MISASLLGPVLCRGTYDLIVVCQLSPVTVGVPAILLKAIKRIPIVFWVLDLWPDSLSAAGGIRSPWVLKAVDRLVRFTYRHSDRILYSSKGFAQSIRDHGADPSALDYFPNWVETAKESDQPPVVVLPEGFRIVFAGNVGEAQDFGTILEAAQRLKAHPSIQWIILGEGRQLPWVQAQVKERGLEGCVHLLGRFPPETMPDFFRQADALLVTLRKDPTFALTVPGKVPSYMSCGRPLLGALDGEGALLIQEAHAGYCVPSGDGEGLARITLDLSRMPAEDRDRIGASARDYCDTHFDRARLFKSLEVIMQDLVRRG
jgi:glycosyltransferase involved in cell wall biosynthesis